MPASLLVGERNNGIRATAIFPGEDLCQLIRLVAEMPPHVTHHVGFATEEETYLVTSLGQCLPVLSRSSGQLSSSEMCVRMIVS